MPSLSAKSCNELASVSTRISTRCHNEKSRHGNLLPQWDLQVGTAGFDRNAPSEKRGATTTSRRPDVKRAAHEPLV